MSDIPAVVGTAGYVIEGITDDHLALKTIMADWELRAVDAWCEVENDRFERVPGTRVVLAGRVPLGTVGKRWHPVQNIELLSMARSFAQAVGSQVAVGGVTPDFRRTWFWIPLRPGLSSIVSTAHDGRGSVSIQLVVDDGESIARFGSREQALMSFPHGPTLSQRFDDPKDLANWCNDWVQDTEELVEELSSAVGEERDFIRLAEHVFPIRGKLTDRKESTRKEGLDRVAARWVESSTARGSRLNALDLVFSFCWYLDHGRDGRPRYLADQALEDSNWVARLKFKLAEEI